MDTHIRVTSCIGGKTTTAYIQKLNILEDYVMNKSKSVSRTILGINEERLDSIKNVLITLQLFLFRHSSFWNKKWTRRHKTFCKIHDAIIIGLGLVACYCFLAAVGTLEQSNATGAAFWHDTFVSFKYITTAIIITLVVGDANDIFYDEYDDEDEF